MSSQTKRDRGQLRQIAKEILPEVLTQESLMAIQRIMFDRLEKMAKHINDRLDAVDQKQKDLHSYVVRQLTIPNIPLPPEENK